MALLEVVPACLPCQTAVCACRCACPAAQRVADEMLEQSKLNA